VRESFIQEFRGVVEEAFGFERTLAKWLSQVESDVKSVVSESVSVDRLAFPMAQMAAQFDVLTVPSSVGGAPEQITVAAPFNTGLLDQSRSVLADFINERGQVAQLRLEAEQVEHAFSQSKVLRMNLEARSLEIKIEKECIDRQLTKFRAQQAEEREKSFVAVRNSKDPESSLELRENIEAIIQELKTKGAQQVAERMGGLREGLATNVHSLGLISAQLWIKIERFARSVQIFDSRLQISPRTPQHEPRSEGIADVEKMLAEIRRRRKDVMRDISRLSAELQTDT
jgi:hypothetical protein